MTPGASWSEYFCWKTLRARRAASELAPDEEEAPLAMRRPAVRGPLAGAMLLPRWLEYMALARLSSARGCGEEGEVKGAM